MLKVSLLLFQKIITKTKDPDPRAEFKEFPVDNSRFIYTKDENNFPSPVNINLKLSLLENLPFHSYPILNDATNPSLKENGIKREPNTIVTFRGDEKDFSEITKSKGIHPRAGLEKCCIDPDEKNLDVIHHRKEPKDSCFISTTVSPQVAHDFGAIHAIDSKKKTYTFYTLQATGAMGPSSSYYPYEHEYSVIGSIKKEDIIAFRNCEAYEEHDPGEEFPQSIRRVSTCSSIFLRFSFLNQHPDLVNSVLQAQLRHGESIRKNVK